ncbi:MAG: phosphoribosylanthranilate isomerase [Planctomycetota bacterium]|nr:phosphoribosylanthranilate isomerase [Planctomycetota bacterium]
MVRTKVCGFTRLEDVRAAVAAGVDAIGLNLAKGPRKISVDQAAAFAAAIPPFVSTVLLFVDAEIDAVRAAVAATGAGCVQLHGAEDAAYATAVGAVAQVIKAFRVRDAATLDAVAGFPADAYLLDAYVPGAEGGTGHAWDHGLLAGRDLGRPVILAGGLTPANVAQAVATVRPYAVDTASGVESAPGIKDAAAMAAFVSASRS